MYRNSGAVAGGQINLWKIHHWDNESPGGTWHPGTALELADPALQAVVAAEEPGSSGTPNVRVAVPAPETACLGYIGRG